MTIVRAGKRWAFPTLMLAGCATVADEALYKAASRLQGTARWNLAAKDADLTFPNAAAVLSCALGMTCMGTRSM